jgi:lipoyl(octanoyl) transferase
MSVSLLDLGRRPYPEVWALQRRLVEARSKGEAPDTLILVEHENVITLGRKTTPENFKPLEVPVFQVERGGDATYHGPGQLVGYPIIKMEVPDVRGFVRSLEEVLIQASTSFSIEAGR